MQCAELIRYWYVNVLFYTRLCISPIMPRKKLYIFAFKKRKKKQIKNTATEHWTAVIDDDVVRSGDDGDDFVMRFVHFVHLLFSQ